MILRCLFLSLALLTGASAFQPLNEKLPKGAEPGPAQKAVVDELSAKVLKTDVEYDADGNVVALNFDNHQQHQKRYDDKGASRPGLADEDFAKIVAFPKLQSLWLLRQPLNDEGYAVLANFPQLKSFRIEYHGNAFDGTPRAKTATSAYQKHVEGLQELEDLEFKHNFRVKDTMVDQLRGFPKLKRLELDVADAASKAVPFLKRCPKIEVMELHRTEMNNDELGEVIDALPKLRDLTIKPGYSRTFDAAFLAHLARAQSLETLSFHFFKPKDLPWENGLEHLVKAPALKQVMLPGFPKDTPAVVKLREARPELEIKGLK